MELPNRTAEQIIGDIGETKTALVFKRWGWTADKIASDYGEDFDCNIFIDNHRTALHFRCQVKSTSSNSSYIRRLKNGDFSISIKTTTLKSWLFSYFPVFIVIYDSNNQGLHWANATDQVRKKQDSLIQKTLSLKVCKHNNLEAAKDLILMQTQKFYENILRLETTRIGCEVYPILMPEYRVLPFHELSKLFPLESYNDIIHEISDKKVELLPAWATALKFIQPFPNLLSISLSINGASLGIFIRSIKELFKNNTYNLIKDEWISFLCSPIALCTSQERDTKDIFWNRELTDWWSYSVVNGRILSDFDYAFDLPKGFLKQIARKAQSWETFHHIDHKNDIAIQLFAAINITPSYKREILSHRQNILSQFISWECPKEKVNGLQIKLNSIGLRFIIIEGISNDDDLEIGIICSPFFNPNLGTYEISINWRDFIYGSIINKLKEKNFIQQIPGKLGPKLVHNIILQKFGSIVEDPPEHIYITERDYIPGFPIKHNLRKIKVHRFRLINNFDEKFVNNLLQKCKKEISNHLMKSKNVESEINIIDYFDDRPIYELCVSWEPLLEESSSESFYRFRDIIIKTFDKIMPQRNGNKKQFQSSYDILRIIGQLYFESAKC